MGERSLSGVPECLSPLAEYSTNERAALTPALTGGASAPQKVKRDAVNSPDLPARRRTILAYG
jgi:hypothetical protein